MWSRLEPSLVASGVVREGDHVRSVHEHAHQSNGQQHDGDENGRGHQDGRGEVWIDHEEQEAGHQGKCKVG